MSDALFVKKLGAKQILGTVKAVVNTMCAKDGDKYAAYSIFGYTDGVRRGTGAHGEFTAFQGEMEATNFVTDERFIANEAFIPEPLSTMLVNALHEGERVEFAFTVYVKRRDELPMGYEYLVTPHKQISEADPLAHLRKLIPNTAQKALRAAKEAESA